MIVTDNGSQFCPRHSYRLQGIEHSEGDLHTKTITIRFHREQVTIGQIQEPIQHTGHQIKEMIL